MLERFVDEKEGFEGQVENGVISTVSRPFKMPLSRFNQPAGVLEGTIHFEVEVNQDLMSNLQKQDVLLI